MIAHRLSPIRNADLLPVMAHDSIVEEGNRDDLIARDGGCARLWNAQFRGAAVVDADDALWEAYS